MQYLLMCCFNEEAWSRLPNMERDQLAHRYGSCIQDMKRSGHYVAGVKQDHGTRVAAMREISGAVSDGSLAKTREQLDCDHVVECKDLTEAISLAKRFPTLSGGAVEVRAVLAQTPGRTGLGPRPQAPDPLRSKKSTRIVDFTLSCSTKN